jgi:recombination protein RecA
MAGKKKTTKDALKVVSPLQERQAKISEILNRSKMLFGDGAMGTLAGDHALESRVTGVIPTGSMGLDEALGVGGYPRGRVIEIFGMESSGKTTLTLHAIANVQKAGGIAAFIDAEHALDPNYAEALGVSLEELLLSQPDNGEQALNMAEQLVRSGHVDLVVIDSVAALVPQAELEGEMGDHHVGLQARLMSQALRKLTGAANRSDCTVIFINQVRMKIGVRFGSPKTTTGGNALKFYSSVRLEVTRIGSLKKNEEAYANKTKVKVVKNKVSPPFRTCEFDIMFGEGIAWASELLDAAVAAGIMGKAGAWYKYGDENIGMGRQNAMDWLKENPEIVETVRRQLSEQGGSA